MAQKLRFRKSHGQLVTVASSEAIIATAERDGFKGDLKILGDVALDVAQAAFRKAEPNFETAIVALATSLSANPLVLVAAELVGGVVQKAADAGVAQAA